MDFQWKMNDYCEWMIIIRSLLHDIWYSTLLVVLFATTEASKTILDNFNMLSYYY